MLYVTCISGIDDCQTLILPSPGSDYKGTVSQTKSGLECRRWDDRTALVSGGFQDSKYIGEDENYCRNPDGDSGGVWCFVDGPTSSDYWEHCSQIPDCENGECNFPPNRFDLKSI